MADPQKGERRRFGDAIGEWDGQQWNKVQPESQAPASAASRFVSGAWQNLNPMGLVHAALHPIDTAGNLVTAQVDQFRKAADDFQQGHYSEMVGHTGAGLLPIVGPVAAQAGETIGAGDVAGGLGQAAGLLTPFAADAGLTALGKARVLPAATSGSLRAGAADVLDRTAVNKFVDQTGPKVGPNKVRLNAKMADVAPKLLREPDLGALTREGLHAKIADRLTQASEAIDDANDARLASQQVHTQPIVAQLDAQIAKLTAHPVEGSHPLPTMNPLTERDIFTRDVTSPPGMGTAPKVIDAEPVARRSDVQAARMGQPVEPAPSAAQIATLRQIRNEVAQLGPVAPYESIRRIRAAWDQIAKAKYMPATAQDALKSQGEATGAMKGTGALRDALAQADPASAAAYQQYSLFKSANDVLTATQEAERARPRVGRSIMAHATGAVIGAGQAGGPGAIVGAIVGGIAERAAHMAPTLQIMVARRLANVADLIRGGNMDAATSIARRLESQLPADATAARAASIPRASGE